MHRVFVLLLLLKNVINERNVRRKRGEPGPPDYPNVLCEQEGEEEGVHIYD